MQISVITIGDEILIGQIIDSNSAWMGQHLNLAGASINRILSVGDELEDIQWALRESLSASDIVLITGGLGPTKDDVTKKAIANFLGVPLAFHQPTYDRIVRIFEKWGRPVTEGHREQSFLPEGVQILPNKMGTAPGMWFEWRQKVIISIPGVPYEMEYLMQKEILPRLLDRFPAQPIAHRTILTVGEGESNIAVRLSEFEQNLPPFLKLAYLPNLGKVRLRLTGKYHEKDALIETLEKNTQTLKQLLPDLIFGEEEEELEAVVGNMLKERKLTLGLAESCTGGHLAHLITSVPGSSAYFHGGVVSYSNALKTSLLKVKPEILSEHGAVSEATVRAMVKGAIELLDTDIAAAISGIAGPGGGSPEKPVGTVWIAVGNGEHIESYLLRAGKDRLKNIQYSSVHALNQIRIFLLQHYPLPPV